MGGKSKKQTSTSTIGPPQYIQDAYQSLIPQAQATAAQPFQAYDGQLTAGLTPEQEAGIAGVTSAQGVAQPAFGQAKDLWGQSASSIAPDQFSSDAIAKFLNPFQQQVTDATLANTAENDRRQQQDLTGKAIMSGAWGGDRAGVAKAELARQQKLGADTTLANLNMQNFNQALQTFQQQQGVNLGAAQNDAQRAAQAASGFANLGTTQQDSQLKDAAALMQAGGLRQQTEQAGLTADYDQFLQEQAYPFMSQGWLANLLTGVGSSAGSTSSGLTKSSGGDSGIGQAIGAAASVASLFSDERVKENIQRIGETFDGQPLYRYNYKGDPATQIGLIAQEVEQTHPEAVGEVGGIKTVDYRRATEDAAGVAGMGGEFAAGGVVVPYTGRVTGRVPTLNPITGKTGLMAPPPAPGIAADPAGSQTDYSKLGTQVGKAVKDSGLFGGGAGTFDANTPRFDFPTGMQLFGPGFASGGVVDMEQDSAGMFRPAYEFGGVAPLGDEYDLFGKEPIGGQDPVSFMPPKFKSSRFDMVNPATAPDVATARAAPEVTPDPGPGGPGNFSPNDVDAMVRTVYGEAARESPEGQRAVAEVIRNRAMQGNMTPTDVVLAKGQFEPWMTRSRELQGLDPNSPEYKAILKNIQPTIEGRAPDVTDQADHFYAPRAQAALGRNAPKWDEGDGVDVGNHRFFDKGYGGHEASSGVAAARSPASGVRATAYAPDEGNGVAGRTTAFDGLKKDIPNAEWSNGGQSKPAPSDGRWGLGYLPPDVQNALLAAGLGMMAAKGTGAQQVGAGGLAGLQYYMNAQASRAKTAKEEREDARKITTEDRDYGLRERGVNNSEKSLAEQAAQRIEARKTEEKRLDFERRRVEVAEREKTNSVAADAAARRAEAKAIGLSETDPRYQSFVLTGKMPREDAQPLSATDKKAIMEADEGVLSAETAIKALNDAKALSKKAYEGPTAGVRGKVTGLFGAEGGEATTELNNLVMSNALTQLKAIFGAAPTEGERKILLDIQGSVDQPDAIRQKIFDRGIAMAEKRLGFNRQRADEMRGGTYYKPQGAKDGKGQPAAAPPAPKAAQPEPARGDVPVMQTPADAQKLAPGTLYRTPDGKEYRR